MPSCVKRTVILKGDKAWTPSEMGCSCSEMPVEELKDFMLVGKSSLAEMYDTLLKCEEVLENRVDN